MCSMDIKLCIYIYTSKADRHAGILVFVSLGLSHWRALELGSWRALISVGDGHASTPRLMQV